MGSLSFTQKANALFAAEKAWRVLVAKLERGQCDFRDIERFAGILRSSPLAQQSADKRKS
jgi:hypothetical protein